MGKREERRADAYEGCMLLVAYYYSVQDNLDLLSNLNKQKRSTERTLVAIGPAGSRKCARAQAPGKTVAS